MVPPIRSIPAFVALLMFAAPISAQPQAIRMMSLCTGAGVRAVPIPLEDDGWPPLPDCGKACHIGCDRRKPTQGG